MAARHCIAACFALMLILPASANAAPSITAVSPRGVQIGQPTTLVITGSDLSADIRLLSETPIARQSVKAGAKANRIELEITLDPTASPGLCAFRVASPSGISSPVVLGVDR